MRNWLGASVSVSQLEYWRSEQRAGHTFGRGDVQGAVAAQASQLQLFNPVGSGVQVQVYSGWFNTDSAAVSPLTIQLYNTQLTTDIGAGFNLLSGGAAGLAHLRKASTAGSVFLGSQVIEFEINNATPVILPNWLCELSPGQGLYAAISAVNVGLFGAFYWREGA